MRMGGLGYDYNRDAKEKNLYCREMIFRGTSGATNNSNEKAHIHPDP